LLATNPCSKLNDFVIARRRVKNILNTDFTV
jgi:hypothetical protein